MTIELSNIIKTYQTGEFALQVLKGITFSIDDGEMVAIMGPSGSGKSTLMNVIGLLDTPTEGQYLLDGQDVSNSTKRSSPAYATRKSGSCSRVTTSSSAHPRWTMYSCHCCTQGCHRMSGAAGGRAQLEAVGLGARMDHKPNELSGGQQQRVSIARSIVMRPSLILADEPTGALDSRSSIEVMDIFQRLNRELGITVIFVTHEPDIAEHMRRVIRIRDGYLGADEIVKARDAADELNASRAPITLPVNGSSATA